LLGKDNDGIVIDEKHFFCADLFSEREPITLIDPFLGRGVTWLGGGVEELPLAESEARVGGVEKFSR
jgi:hypothetical protein